MKTIVSTKRVVTLLTLMLALAFSAGLPGDQPRKTHWAFVPPVRPAEPNVANPAWARNPVDRFVLARLEEEGIRPSPEADRTTLIRRLSLDLLGLPPSIKEVDEFLADARPDAYKRLVDRLLESPHYGERWGRHWLDAARYADSNGYTIDGARSIWKYRDWVIDALNRDMPFDQFTVEQIAGDMLPDPSLDQVIATGFHRNTQKNEEGGTDPEQYRVEAIADRVSTTGSVFLGLTLGCARCHDHKYDPISQREYYHVFALLNNADEPALPVPTTQQSKEEPALVAEIAEAEKRLGMVEENSGTRHSDWEKLFAGRLAVEWTVLDPVESRSEGGATITKLDDRSLVVGGKLPEHDSYVIVVDVPAALAAGISAVRLETLTHDSLPHGGPGLASNGNFVLSEFRVATAGVGNASTPSPVQKEGRSEGSSVDLTPVVIAVATADYSQDKYPVAAAIDGNANTGWAINVPGQLPGQGMNVNRTAEFTFSDEIKSDSALRLVIALQHARAHYALGRFRVSVTSAPRDVVSLPAVVRDALEVAPDKRNDAQKKIVREEFNKVDKERIPIAGRVAELKELHKQLKSAVTTTLVMQERKQLRETHVHLRGDFLRPGDRVDPGVPAVLPAIRPAGDRANRLDFARWLVDPANPLTARVTVNRVWQQYFGTGLVATENDFGTQGSPPSHPELLDWLATEFMSGRVDGQNEDAPTAFGTPALNPQPSTLNSPWRLKHVHRLIVTSATYRQSSRFRSDLTEKDPTNKWLARQARPRLEAETIRDVALAAGGLLSREIGGPGTYPPQPQGIYRFTQVVKFWKEPDGPDRYRRGLYVYFWRSSPYPFLTTFDAPDANVTCTRRVRSNTPLQALTLANDRAFVEVAQALAARVLREGPPSDPERIRFAFRTCLAREPLEHESRNLAEFYRSQRNRFEQAQSEAEALAPKPLPDGTAPTEAAAWTALARVLINLDEFITRE